MDFTAGPGWTPAKVRAVVQGLGAALSGRGPDTYNVAKRIQIRCGLKLLQLIQERFVIMARDQPDPITGEVWPDLSPVTVAKKMKISIEEAYAKIAGVDYSIGIDTNLMFRSLSPGVDGHSGEANQIFEIKPGEAIVGTNLERADRFHKGDSSNHQPPRPLWTDPLPDEWLDELAQAEADALAEAVGWIVSTQRPPS